MHMKVRNRRIQIISLVALTVVCWSMIAGNSLAEELGVTVPDGFKVELYADDDLAHDVYSMTVDAEGRVVVSGQGYVRILIDADGDGKAESFKQFADGPASGAQGMFWLGSDLFCSGDDGLIRFADQNHDDRADGPPQTFLKIKTGSEHNAHAIRRGPDGWWYVIAGNTAEVNAGYANLPTSPIKAPEQGTILRLKPDLTGGEVIAHGFRNAYDFDFGILGDIFSFDSDDERDVSLPWYRPARVFQVTTGSHMGWISKGWKRPDYYLDMPPVIGSFGRASPTGVVCYRHEQFPDEYIGALFIEDWTFGRVWVMPMQREGATWKSEPKEFMTAVGDHGFAPTDVDVGTDGSLYVSIGGRGTRGGVYRVSHADRMEQAKRAGTATIPSSADEQVSYCLKHPMPLSSWGRRRWIPTARQLGVEPFLKAAKDQQLSVSERVRAIEILTELHQGIPETAVAELLRDPHFEVRSRALWSMMRIGPRGWNQEILQNLIGDPDAMVRRNLYEFLVQYPELCADPQIGESLVRGLDDESKEVARACVRVVSQTPDPVLKAVGEQVRKSSWRAALMFAYAQYERQQLTLPGINAYAIEMGRRILDGKHPPELQLDSVRLIQLGLGDMGLYGNLPLATRGYTSRFDLTGFERELDPLRVTISKLYPTGHLELDEELSRTGAILGLINPEFLEKVLATITDESNPTADIHALMVASRLPVSRNNKARIAIAKGLVNIEVKIHKLKMQQDTNWSDRITEMYNLLVEQDPELVAEISNQPGFGLPGHMLILGKNPSDQLPNVIKKFAKAAEDDPEYPWNNDVVFLFGAIESPENRKVLREQYENFSVRSSAVISLSYRPQAEDRPKFIEGLESSQIEVLTACIGALEKLPETKESAEVAALIKAARRLGKDKAEFPLRDRVVKLLERNTGIAFPYVYGEAGYYDQLQALNAWSEWAIKEYPEQADGLSGGSASELEEIRKLATTVSWDAGDPIRGRKVFESRACHQCHMGSRALGPDLAGVAGRFSREDLLTAIIIPSRDVSPRYQTTAVETKDGKIITGMVIYESVDGVLLRNSTNQSFRIEAVDIESQRKVNTSLMPTGLLKDLPPEQIADLFAYLRSLTADRSPELPATAAE